MRDLGMADYVPPRVFAKFRVDSKRSRRDPQNRLQPQYAAGRFRALPRLSHRSGMSLHFGRTRSWIQTTKIAP